MRTSCTRLDEELRVWRRWAATAGRDENGWQSDAPNWDRLIQQAQAVLLERDLVSHEVLLLEEVFCLSEEDETLADFLRINYEEVSKDTVHALSLSAYPQVRWQIYDSLVIPEEFSRGVLLHGLEDADTYARRRAFLRLLSYGPLSDAVLKRAATDIDPVIRDEAKKLLA